MVRLYIYSILVSDIDSRMTWYNYTKHHVYLTIQAIIGYLGLVVVYGLLIKLHHRVCCFRS
uniref:Uncharacterized protein n=1 Tax=Anguilla anguilla TaxID=7936 RepID=A0A0E9VCL8_ANGAN